MADNVYELRHRAMKVTRLVAVLDAHLSAAGVHPFTPRAGDAIAALSAEAWARASQLASCNPPSAKTVAEIVKVYRARPEHLADVRRSTGV